MSEKGRKRRRHKIGVTIEEVDGLNQFKIKWDVSCCPEFLRSMYLSVLASAVADILAKMKKRDEEAAALAPQRCSR